jgi:hypothetical protein
MRVSGCVCVGGGGGEGGGHNERELFLGECDAHDGTPSCLRCADGKPSPATPNLADAVVGPDVRLCDDAVVLGQLRAFHVEVAVLVNMRAVMCVFVWGGGGVSNIHFTNLHYDHR